MAVSKTNHDASVAQLAEAIYRDKVRRARLQPPAEKLLAGLTLFERGLELTRLDVERQLGTSEPRAVDEGLRARVERVRRARSVGLYQPIVTSSDVAKASLS